jgi:hypothetical protein
VLRECLSRWQRFGGEGLDVIVIEDGCKDGTPALLDQIGANTVGRRHLRWIHEEDAHELRCTNRGSQLRAVIWSWRGRTTVPARAVAGSGVARHIRRVPGLGDAQSQPRLNCLPLEEPLERWEDLIDWRRLQSTIGRGRATGSGCRKWTS